MTRAYQCPCGRNLDSEGECADCTVICALCDSRIHRDAADVLGRFADGRDEAFCRDTVACADAALERARISATYNARVLGLSC